MATHGFAHERSIDARRIGQIRRALVRWGDAHFQTYPWRRELPLWQGLVAEVLLQRTRAAQVAPVFDELIRRYPSAQRFAMASERDIQELITSLGLRWRAPLLHRLASSIGVRKGHLPRTQVELEALPGVGPYAAGAALSLHGNTRALIIDSNVVRVLSRLVGAPYDGETRRKRWLRELSDELTPHDGHRRFNYALLDLAMLLCSPRSPRCNACPLRAMCVTGTSLAAGATAVRSPSAGVSGRCVVPTSRMSRTTRATSYASRGGTALPT